MIGVDAFLGITGGAAEEGAAGSCMNKVVYPTAVKSALKSLTEGVVLCVLGVSRKFKKDPEVKRTEVIDGRRPREIERLRELETDGLRAGE